MRTVLKGELTNHQYLICLLAGLPGLGLLIYSDHLKSASLYFIGGGLLFLGVMTLIYIFRWRNAEKEEHRAAYLIRWMELRGSNYEITELLSSREVILILAGLAESTKLDSKAKGEYLEIFWNRISEKGNKDESTGNSNYADVDVDASM